MFITFISSIIICLTEDNLFHVFLSRNVLCFVYLIYTCSVSFHILRCASFYSLTCLMFIVSGGYCFYLHCLQFDTKENAYSSTKYLNIFTVDLFRVLQWWEINSKNGLPKPISFNIFMYVREMKLWKKHCLTTKYV